MTKAPRLGQASIVVTISDEDGFRVKHGTDLSATLHHVPADQIKRDDWSKLWEVIRNFGSN